VERYLFLITPLTYCLVSELAAVIRSELSECMSVRTHEQSVPFEHDVCLFQCVHAIRAYELTIVIYTD